MNVILTRHWRLALTLGLIATFLLLYALRAVMFPFALGLVFAYVLLPAISWIERRLPRARRRLEARRVSLVAGIFVLGFGLTSAASFYMGTTITHSLGAIVSNAPGHTSAALLQVNK